jgi:hypothetical protein
MLHLQNKYTNTVPDALVLKYKNRGTEGAEKLYQIAYNYYVSSPLCPKCYTGVCQCNKNNAYHLMLWAKGGTP